MRWDGMGWDGGWGGTNARTCEYERELGIITGHYKGENKFVCVN